MILKGLSQKDFLLSFGSPFIHSSMMFSKQKVLELGGYNEKYYKRQDLELWLRTIYSGLEICILKEPLIGFRYHPNSVSEKGTEQHYVNVTIKALYRSIDLDIETNAEEIGQEVRRDDKIRDYVARVVAKRRLKMVITRQCGLELETASNSSTLAANSFGATGFDIKSVAPLSRATWRSTVWARAERIKMGISTVEGFARSCWQT